MRLIPPRMFPPQISPMGVPLSITILQQAQGLLERPRAHVQAQVRLDLQAPGIVDELVQAEMVGFFREPGEFDTFWARGDGSDAVLPVPVGYVVS